MKNEKNHLGFLIPKIWQILKCFSRHFHQAQTVKLLGVKIKCSPIPWRPINPNGAPLQDLQNGLKPKLEPKLDA